MPAGMSPSAIKRGIYGLAVALLLGLGALKLGGAERKLMVILTIASGLLVGLLLITYRAFAGVAEAAQNAPPPPAGVYDDEDEDDT